MNSHEQRHRNMHSDDKAFFSGTPLLHVQQAVDELCWLFDRGYARHSAIKLVGDHHQLSKRQRLAISRAACSNASRNARAVKCLPLEAIKNQALVIDGFNLIITVETAIAGGLLLRCRDDCIRDLASVHGTYQQVQETRQALYCIGQALETLAPESVLWLFDAPVSNSGRLAGVVRDMAETHRWNWRAELTDNPDQAIIAGSGIAVSSDSVILDGVARWVNLGAYLIAQHFPQAWLLDFSNDLNKVECYRLEP
jgi:hypothetical protein